MAREGRHTTSDIITVFARQGIAVSVLARAMAMLPDAVQRMCDRAHEAGELQMIPPAEPDAGRSYLVELATLRSELDDALQQVRNMTSAQAVGVAGYVGVAGMTPGEAGVIAAIAKYGRAHKSAIYEALYGGQVDPPEPKTLEVLLCKARAKLKPFGVTVETLWGVGYAMSPESVAILKALAAGTRLETVDAPRLVPSLQGEAA